MSQFLVNFNFQDFNEHAWELFREYSGRTLNALIIIVIISIIRRVGTKVIKRIFALEVEKLSHSTETAIRRKTTLEGLTLNVWRYTVNIVMLVAIIGSFFNLSTLVTSAGFLTVAITFAFQSVLSDIVKGFFIVFEDIFSVGDMVLIAGQQGTVLEIGIRSTKIKNFSGEIITIPNGEIGQVTNFSVSNAMAILDVLVATKCNLEFVMETLEQLAAEVESQYDEIVSPPKILGVQSMDANETTIRFVAEVAPLQKFYIERELRKVIKKRFEEVGIEMPLSAAQLLRPKI